MSVLFCDLVGFTAASERADPEDVRARIRPYHARLREVVERHGGTVEKFVGDAVMAVFGAPVTHEDDAERAVRAGLRILEAIGELNGPIRVALQVRVGINTGEAVVALGARPELGEGIVTGDVVNTASRLQGVAPVNGVAVRSRRSGRRSGCSMGAVGVGVGEGQGGAARDLRPLQARARFGSDVTRMHATPLVGRDLERTLLNSIFERAVQQQSCQLVTVIGEPGVGKSRLVGALRDTSTSGPSWSAGGRGGVCRTERGSRSGPGRDREGGVPGSWSRLAGRGAREARAGVNADGCRGRVAAGPAAPLVGLAGGRRRRRSRSPPGAASSSCSRRTAGGAGVRGSALGGRGVPRLPRASGRLGGGVPLLVIVRGAAGAVRAAPDWAAGSATHGRSTSAPLTDGRRPSCSRPSWSGRCAGGEQQALLERAGGNPLYAEEFVAPAHRPRRPGREVEVPVSVQALIAARLDTLTAGAEDAASGRRRDRQGVLGRSAGRDGRAEPARGRAGADELTRKELVRPARNSSMAGEAEYGFWHALVRDVGYGQIPRAAGRTSTRRRPAGSSRGGRARRDRADVLAHHYLAALELSRADRR